MEIEGRKEFDCSFPSDYLSASSLTEEVHSRISALFKKFEKVVPDIREQLLISKYVKVCINNDVRVHPTFKIPFRKWLAKLGLEVQMYNISWRFSERQIELKITSKA